MCPCWQMVIYGWLSDVSVGGLSKKAFLSLMTPLIIVGGIWSGIFTPTESEAVASIYAIVLGMVIYRDVSWKDLLDIFKSTVEFTAIILFIISAAGLYGWLLVPFLIPILLTILVLIIFPELVTYLPNMLIGG